MTPSKIKTFPGSWSKQPTSPRWVVKTEPGVMIGDRVKLADDSIREIRRVIERGDGFCIVSVSHLPPKKRWK